MASKVSIASRKAEALRSICASLGGDPTGTGGDALEALTFEAIAKHFNPDFAPWADPSEAIHKQRAAEQAAIAGTPKELVG